MQFIRKNFIKNCLSYIIDELGQASKSFEEKKQYSIMKAKAIMKTIIFDN